MSIFLALLAATAGQSANEIYPSDIMNSGEYVGFWSASPPWEVYEYEADGEGLCTIYSAPVRTPMGSYQLAVTFGTINEVALATSAPISGAQDAALDFNDGSGFDWNDIVAHKIEKPHEHQLTYWYGNTMSSGMVQKLISALKVNRTAIFTYAGSKFPLSLTGFTAAYADMRRCENHRVGRVLED